MIMIKCNCKAGCKNKLCTCVKNNQRCTVECGCRNCFNSPDVSAESCAALLNDLKLDVSETANDNDYVEKDNDDNGYVKKDDDHIDYIKKDDDNNDYVKKDNDNETIATKITLKDLLICNCGEMCDTNRCACRKANRKCDPKSCGCCTRYAMICNNVAIGTIKEFSIVKSVLKSEFLDVHVDNINIASWNIQSFGHNIGSRKWRATCQRIVEFINVYNIDCLFIQETCDIKAIEEIRDAFNRTAISIDRQLASSTVEIGDGFNRSLAAQRLNPKVTEYAAALCRNEFICDGELMLEKIEIKLNNPVPLDHGQNPDMEYKYKRAPAFCKISIPNKQSIAFVSCHLASDGGTQMLRLNEELRSLPDVHEYVRNKTGVDDVIILGDLNRTYLHSNNRSYPFKGLAEILIPVLSSVKTNTSLIKDELYDNFWVPESMSNVIIGKVANDFLKIFPHTDAIDTISDHYPIVLSIPKNYR